MRTDSLNLSQIAINQAKKEIEKNFGAEFVKTRVFKTKSAGAQEAHEAIRPTNLGLRDLSGDSQEARLYSLIWKRTIASQMAEAKIEKTTATIGISTSKEKLTAEGEIITFPGFLEVYIESHDEGEEAALQRNMLPPIKKGQNLPLKTLQAKEGFARPPARYTEASLVKKMEEMGIGRPSTYAPTISTIQDRGYIEKKSTEGQERAYRVLYLQKGLIKKEEKMERTGAEKNKLFPTDTGLVVNDFLVKHFPNIVDYHFTATVEESFDKIAHGKEKWRTMISNFYKPFHKTVEESADISRAEASHMRKVGIDPKTKKPIFARIGRYGPMLQLGETESEEKLKFASIPKDKSIENITLEEALPLFALPRVLGKNKEGEEVITQIGRFGPYIKSGKTFVSIKQDEIFSITLKEALKRVEEKQAEAKNKIIQEFKDSDIQVLNGRYGPYITNGKKNAKIPKDSDPKKLTLQECQKLLEEAPAKKKGGWGRKKKK